jgi:predicted nucleic acid-binding protein
MNLYAESSAVLAWLLGEPASDHVQPVLAAAATVCSSELTLIECDRALRRAAVLNDLTEADAAELRGVLAGAARSWHLCLLEETVLERARREFPDEPVRTLDALHLASMLHLTQAVHPLTILSLDQRVRRNATALGFSVVP